MAKRKRPESRGSIALRDWIACTKNMNQSKLARRLGVRQSNVGSWLNGNEPKIAMALELRRVARIPLIAWTQPAAA